MINKLPNIIIQLIYNQLEEDEDKFMLYLTCKKLNRKQYLYFNRLYDCRNDKKDNQMGKCRGLIIERCKLLVIDFKTKPKIESILNQNITDNDNMIVEEIIYKTPPNINLLELPKSIKSLSLIFFDPHILPQLPIQQLTRLSIEVDEFRDDSYIEPLMERIEQDNHLQLEYLRLVIRLPRLFKSFPRTLVQLELPQYNSYLKTPLPDTIKYLELGSCVVTNGCLPKKLEVFKFKLCDSQLMGVGFFPDTLTDLTLIEYINEPFYKPGFFPKSLKRLTMDGGGFYECVFNQVLDRNNLPSTLESLVFTSNVLWRIPQSNVLPEGLKQLVVGKVEQLYSIQSTLFLKLPSTLTELSLKLMNIDYSYRWKVELDMSLVKSLVKLETYSIDALIQGTNPYQFNNSLEKLIISRGYNEAHRCPITSISPLPLSITYLYLGIIHTISPGLLPNSIQHLVLATKLSSPLDPGSLPPNIIQLDSFFDNPIDEGVLPLSLKILKLKKYTSLLYRGIFPDGLEHLEIGDEYEHALWNGTFPSSLKTLTLSLISSYQWHIDLPNNLLKLYFNQPPHKSKFNYPRINQFPPSLLIFFNFTNFPPNYYPPNYYKSIMQQEII